MYSSGFRNIRRSLAVFLCAVLLLTFFNVNPSTTQKAIAATTNTTNYVFHTTEDWPTYIDPAVGNDFSDSIALVNLYDSLVFPTPQGTVIPWLALKWTTSKDGLVYTFTLRHGVKFHNGDPFTANDVVFSMNRLVTIGQGFAYIFKPYIKSTKATGTYTVVFTLKKPFGPFVSALPRLYIADQKQVMAHIKAGTYGKTLGDYGANWLLTHDAGSGPYTVKEMSMEDHLIGTKFSGYWGGWNANAPQTFEESATSQPSSELTAFAKRDLDITDELLPLETYQAIAKLKGATVVTYLNGHNLNIMLNTKKAPTDDVHFRKALAYAFDYNTVIKNIYPGSSVSKGPVPANLLGHDPKVVGYTTNLVKAKAELALSKYAKQLNQYPVTMSWCAEAPAEEKVALLFQADCAQLGVKVQITKKPFGSMEADATTIKTTPNASVVFVGVDYPEAGAMLSIRYASASAGSWEQCEWLQNSTIDKMISDALGTSDQAARIKKYYAIQEKIVDLCPTIWVMDQAEQRAYQSAYVDWPVADAIKAHKTAVCSVLMGYCMYVHDLKVFPTNRAKLLSSSSPAS
jgi:peptide/nickel transport system substrate-binding protein